MPRNKRKRKVERVWKVKQSLTPAMLESELNELQGAGFTIYMIQRCPQATTTGGQSVWVNGQQQFAPAQVIEVQLFVVVAYKDE